MSEEHNPADEAGEELSLEIEEDDGQQAPEPVDGGDADIESGDEGSPRGDEDEAAVEGVEERRRPSRVNRASQRFHEITLENRDLRQRLENLERVQQQPRQPSQDELRAQEAAEEQRFFAELQQQVMDPVQQAARISQFYNQRTEQRVSRAIQNTQFTTWDSTDRINFERVLADNPRLERFGDRVEELRRQAPGVSRVDLLDKAIGESVRRQAGAQRTCQQNGAAARNGAQRTQPSRPAANVPGERRQGQRRGFEHMRNVPI